MAILRVDRLAVELEMSIQTWPRLQGLVLELALPLFQEVLLACPPNLGEGAMASISPSAGISGLMEFGLIPDPVE